MNRFVSASFCFVLFVCFSLFLSCPFSTCAAYAETGKVSMTGTFVIELDGFLRFIPDDGKNEVYYELSYDPSPYYDYLGVKVKMEGEIDSEMEMWEMQRDGRIWLADQAVEDASPRKVQLNYLTVSDVKPISPDFTPTRTFKLPYYVTPGTDPVVIRFMGNNTCYTSQQYVAIEVSEEEAGSDSLHFMAIDPGKSPEEMCVAAKNGVAPTIEDDDYCYFQGMAGSVALIDCGSGTDPRGLLVYDLTNDASLLEASSFTENGDGPVMKGNVLQWTTEAPEAATETPCPEAATWESQGFSVLYKQKRQFDITSGNITDMGKPICTMAQ